jgi:crossover junction endodeoxyribonuclease RusA
MTVFTLPVLPPSANRIWRRSGSRIHKSSAYTNWLSASAMFAKGQRPKAVSGPYKLTIAAVRPDKRRRDIDNLIKPISDLLVSIGIVRDDSDCDMVSARWVTRGEGVSIRIEPAGVE